MTLYAQGKYWDAFFVFSRILVEFPDFFKNDWVVYYRGRCEEALDMRRAATDNFQEVKKSYAQSDAVPYADLGIMRVCYRNDDFVCVAGQYALLAQIGVPDSLRFHAAYLMGEAFLKQGEYFKAIQVFIQIPPKHPAYVFAQNSIAVARILAGVPRDQVLLALGACIDAEVSTPAQKEAVYRAYVFFGYLFYENGELPKAVTALRSVPATSYYYEDALLGLAWCAVRAQQWADCINASKLLSAATRKETVRLEAMLLEGFGHFQQKEYALSFALLDNARGNASSVSAPSEDTLTQHRGRYDNTRIGYDFLADNVEKVSLKAPSPYMLQQIDSLHTRQVASKDTIDGFLKYADEFGRLRLFARPLDEIKQDIEYTHATVQRRIAETGDEKLKLQVQEEQRKLNEEIRKLKEEMKGMEEGKKKK
jgi:tetratricopeptide (TPR) repeat protein